MISEASRNKAERRPPMKRLMNPRILLFAGVSAALGSALGGALFPFWAALILLALPVLLLFAFFAWKRFFRILPAALLAVFLFFYGYAFVRMQGLETETNAFTKGSYYITGTVENIEYKDTRTLLKLSQVTLRGEANVNLRAHLQLSVYNSVRTYKAGERLYTLAEAAPVSPPANPGQADFTRYYFAQGITALAGTEDGGIFVVSEEARPMAFFLSLKARLTGFVYNVTGGENAAFLSALLFGGSELWEEGNAQAFQDLGITHLIAVSGLHVALLGYAIYALLARLRLPRWGQLLLLALFFFGYSAICAFTPSVVRASLMFIMLFSVKLLGERYDMLNALGAAALLLLLWQPLNIFLAGFQLSFLACIGIALYAKKLHFAKTGPLKAISADFSVTCSAQLATFPLTANMSSQISLFTLPANLIFIPFSTLILYLAFAGVLLSLIYVPLGGVFLGAASFLSGLFLQSVRLLSSIPGTVVALPFIAGMLLAGYYWCFALLSPLILRPLLKKALAAACGTVLFLAAFFVPRLAPKQEFEIVFLSVGQADCAYIGTPGGETLFV